MTNAWMMPEAAFQFVRRRIEGRSVLELGSGEGTSRLVRWAGAVTSIEHDPAFIGMAEGARYIHAPIVGDWYDPAAIRAVVGPDFHYDCLIVDGPPGSIGRIGLLKHLDLFKRVPLLVDDVHRRPEFELAVALAREWGGPWQVHYQPDGRAFATIGWGNL